MTPHHQTLSGLSMPTQLDTPDGDKSGLSEADTSTSTTTSGMPSPGVVDQDLAHMETQLDNWTTELKRNVLVSCGISMAGWQDSDQFVSKCSSLLISLNYVETATFITAFTDRS